MCVTGDCVFVCVSAAACMHVCVHERMCVRMLLECVPEACVCCCEGSEGLANTDECHKTPFQPRAT